MRISRFEDIDSWKKAREVTRLVYTMSSQGDFARDFALRDQIRRAIVSIMSNIAEGFERGGDREFIQFLSIAKGSCGEARAQLYVALDQNYISEDQFNDAYDALSEVGRMIGGFMKYLQQSELRGSKFKQ
ncbi:MAG: four helix bundle protein [Pyrinomonadaceae bacterium]